MSTEPALSIRNLSVAYGAIHAIQDVSIDVHDGEIVTLIGANGAGKSSVLRALSGMIPFQGSIRYNGHELRGLTPDRIVAAGLAHVPEGRGIFGNLTVLENLKLATWQSQLNKPALALEYERVFNLFPRLGERKHQSAGTLSGGEQQMLALGRALMSRAKLMLLDEPSMGLAPLLVQEIFNVIRNIHAAGTTILLVEQNAHMALRTASRGYVLETGRITLTGTGADLLGHPRVKDAYLGG